MTVEESLSFLLDIWNIDTSECEAKVKYALDERLLGVGAAEEDFTDAEVGPEGEELDLGGVAEGGEEVLAGLGHGLELAFIICL